MENSAFDDFNNIFPVTDTIPLSSKGSTSDTYKVRINGKWHFLKRPKKEYSTHPAYIAAFEKEFDIGYTLDHNHIVRYVGKAYDENGIYFLTEYVDGYTLTDFIKKFPVYFQKKEHTTRFINQLLSALEYLHNKQILHLDLKPDNILITAVGQNVKVVDLGFAYSDCYQFLTSGKSLKYAAPEQIGSGKIGEWTDLYALGLILLYIFTESVDCNQLNKLPKKVRNVVERCLNKDYADRFNNIQELNTFLSKKEYSLSRYILIIAIIGCSAGAFFYISKVKDKEISIVQEEDSIVFTPSKDTIVTPEILPVVENLKSDTEITPQLKEKSLESRIQQRIKNILVPFYATYTTINECNWEESLSAYSEKTREIFSLADTFALQTNKKPEEIMLLVRKYGEIETEAYRIQRRKHEKEKGGQWERDEKNILEIVQEQVSVNYKKFYSENTEIILENYQTTVLAHRAMNQKIRNAIDSISKAQNLDKYRFITPLDAEMKKNDSLYNTMIDNYNVLREKRFKEEEELIRVLIENYFSQKSATFFSKYSQVTKDNFDEMVSTYWDIREKHFFVEINSIAIKEKINVSRFTDNPLFKEEVSKFDSLYKQKIEKFKSN